MAKSVRQQRVKAVDDLRDMADALEQAAELFEDALGDLDRVTANGGGHRPGKNLTYEEQQEAVKAYRILAPGTVEAYVQAHLNETDQHDNETCVLCQPHLRSEKGWLTTFYHKMLKRVIVEMRESGELDDVLSEVEVERVREQEREWLRERGRLVE